MLKALRDLIDGLSESEAKTWLFQFLYRLQMLDQLDESKEEVAAKVCRMYHEFLDSHAKKARTADTKAAQNVHLVVGASMAGSLNIALEHVGRKNEELVIWVDDLLSIGPVWRLHEESGVNKRQEWLCEHLHDEDDYYMGEYAAAFLRFLQRVDRLRSDVPVTLWVGENAHEQTALRFLVYLLRDKANPVRLINTTARYHEVIRPQYDIVFRHSGEMSAKDLAALYAENRENGSFLSEPERKRLEREWLRLSAEERVLRVWKDGQLHSAAEDSFDQDIVQSVRDAQRRGNGEFIKAARAVGEAMANVPEHVGDAFIEYRVRQLIYEGILEIKGVPKAMRSYSIRLKERASC